MTVLYLILLLLSAGCFALDAFTDAKSTRIRFVSAGLFFWVLVALIQTVRALS